MKRRLQIGVVGSMADLEYSVKLEKLAAELGEKIAASNSILVFGAEKDSDSLPTVAAVAARQAGGTTIGITYEKGLEVYSPDACSAVIATGLVRGGGRELVQALSCDGIIAVSGGSGTLNEITVAYQANIPVVALAGTGGWSAKLANSYLDSRRRYRLKVGKTAEEAIEILLNLVQSKQGND